jgi:WD repeat-containing protein 61
LSCEPPYGSVSWGYTLTAHSSQVELPAFSAAIHPNQACWAYSGRSSKLAIRPISTIEPSTSTEGESSTSVNGNGSGAAVGRGPLGGEGKVVNTGKGKFGMDVKFVRTIS